jgi:hypothetical protein
MKKKNYQKSLGNAENSLLGLCSRPLRGGTKRQVCQTPVFYNLKEML